MKTFAKQISFYFGIALIMAFVFSCQQEPNPDDSKKIPAALQGTEWSAAGGITVKFTEKGVKLEADGTTKECTLYGIEYKDGGTVIYYFTESNQTKNGDFIECVNNEVTEIKLGDKHADNNITRENNNSGNDTVYTSGDYKYIIEGSSATIIEYTGNGGNVTIPSTLGGKPVTKIADLDVNGYAEFLVFANKNINSISIPNSITYKGRLAFNGNKLKNIFIPKSVAYLGYGIFDNNNIESITFEDGNTSLTKIEHSIAGAVISWTFHKELTEMRTENKNNLCFPSSLSVTIGKNVSFPNYKGYTGELNTDDHYDFESFYGYSKRAAGTYTRPSKDDKWTKTN